MVQARHGRGKAWARHGICGLTRRGRGAAGARAGARQGREQGRGRGAAEARYGMCELAFSGAEEGAYDFWQSGVGRGGGCVHFLGT
jgi:hypothetical protein